MNDYNVMQSLRAKAKDLERQIDDREEIQVEKLADPLDVSTAQSARDTAGANINRATLLLREVRLAIRRMEEGDFGICVDCDEDIPEKRLAAIPWAARCIPCQEAKDNQDKAEGNPRRLANRRITLFEEIEGREGRNAGG